MQTVNTSVEMIADDSKQLGGEIQVVDSAMKSVENSNKNMVDNMKLVQDIMVTIKESIIDSETTTATMVSKYEETARNVINIESVVAKLVEELGAGGFMNHKDIMVGMKLSIMEQGSKREYRTEVADIADEKVFIEASSKADSFMEDDVAKKKYEVHIVVNNTVYIWNQIGIKKKDKYYQLLLDSNPKVMNRRKHQRLAMTNSCDISLKSKNRSFSGKLVNISAGGYVFACKANEFANATGELVQVTIHNFDLLKDKPLDGIIIRSSNDNGTYIVGCRMLEDNTDILNYVKERVGK